MRRAHLAHTPAPKELEWLSEIPVDVTSPDEVYQRGFKARIGGIAWEFLTEGGEWRVSTVRVIKSKNRVFEISRNGMDWLAEIGKQTSAVLDDTGKAIGLHLLCHCAGPQWSRAPLLLQAHGLG
jgi:hypothetical protein